MTTGIILSWLGLILSMLVFLFILSEVSWRVFLFTFWVVDNYLQDRHMRKLKKMWADSEELHIKSLWISEEPRYAEGQETAA